MDGGDGDRERFGRALRLGALAVSFLALFAVVGPRLASSGGGGAPAAASLPDTGEGGAAPGGTSAVSSAGGPSTHPEAAGTAALTPASTTSAAASASSTESTTTTVVVTTAASQPTTTTTTTRVPAEPDGGAVDLAVAGLHAGRYGPPRDGFFAGDVIGWHFRVTNVGDEQLWGVFVYLEGYGPVACGARRLEVGSGTDCWAEATAGPDQERGEAWATAWTRLRMVSDRFSQQILIPAD